MGFEWRPNPGPQELAHASTAFELLYGGAAGGGKSEFLLMEALRYISVPGYSAILFRRTFPELKQPRGLIERSRLIYPHFDGKYNEQMHTWRFPSGATIAFKHMEHEDDKYEHQSAEYAYVGFDELTTFTEGQYLYLFSRTRNPFGIPSRIRAASNPGNVGHEWVFNRWSAWLDKSEDTGVVDADGIQLKKTKARPGKILYYIKDQESDLDIEVPRGTKDALSRQFIPAKLADNPKLTTGDPGYEARLKAMSYIDRQRLLHGDWDALLTGNVFKAEWWKRTTHHPQDLKWYRYWDLAASVRTSADFTASLAGALDKEANLYLKGGIRIKAEWPDVKNVIITEMLTEPEVHHGVEEASFGLLAMQELLRVPEIAGIKFRGIKVDKDKLSRALPLSQRAEQGKVFLVEGPWVPGFITEAALFDGSGKTKDDQVDAASGVLGMVAKPKWRSMRYAHL